MKHIIAILLFLAATTVFADPAPFGLEIGNASLADAEQMYRLDNAGINRYSLGHMYKVTVNQVNFEGLKELLLDFNEKGVLTTVTATLPKSQFKSLHQSLAKKYKVISQEIPFVGDSFTEYLNGSTKVLLDAPHLSFDMRLTYITKETFDVIATKLKVEAAAKKKSQEDKL